MSEPDEARVEAGPQHPAGLPDLIATSTDADCPRCHGSGLVCEEHPDRPWDAGSAEDCQCGGAGQPCACTGMGPQ